MLIFELLAERRILAAMERGELDALPGSGRPLELDDDAMVPQELRMAYRILKNAGMLPEAIAELGTPPQPALGLLGSGSDARRARAARRLELLEARLARAPGAVPTPALDDYRRLIVERMTAPRG